MKLQRIAEQAQRYPEMVFNNVFHLIDRDFLREAYRQTRKNSAPGVDKVTAKQYAEDLDENLRDLHERLRYNRYVALPVERVWIDKENGEKRPISKPCFEDKIVQRAVVMILEAIFDHHFHEFSHAFRKGHSPHQALHELREKCRVLNIKWIVDADVCGFFDNIDRGRLRELIKQRVNDGGILRLIGKWLKAGVLDAGTLIHPDKGTPQGGVISPMLANIFLHHVLDEWFVKDIQPRMKGRCFPQLRENSAKGKGTFDFLGFTHYWAKSRRGYWVIKRKTVGKRLRRFMKEIWAWCCENRHEPLKEQYGMLCTKLRGYYQYYGIRGNFKMLEVVFEHTERAWRYWLSRRSHKGQINWQKFVDSLRNKLPLPKPRIIHTI
jgi:retron-type reverse transcriptase